jgi:hypothetical protein
MDLASLSQSAMPFHEFLTSACLIFSVSFYQFLQKETKIEAFDI